jgi:dTMP kinase
MTRGRFITFEGGEGAGKSTLVAALAAALREAGKPVLVTREPGGAPGADAIRALLVSGDTERWSALEEAMLFNVARRNHLQHTILPALKRGETVLCDRYYDSTRAYQSAAGGVSEATLTALTALIEAPRPDHTFILDIEPQRGLARSRGAAIGEDRFERKDLAFHERVRAAFLAIAAAESDRCVVLDATAPPERLLERALAALTKQG